MAWFLKALVYWGHDLESDITRSAISHVIDNQNDDGSWGDTKGTKGNAIHTTRMLESFSLLFRRHHISQSFFEAIMPHVKVEYLTLSIEDQVAANVRTEKEGFDTELREKESEIRRLRLLLTGIALALATVGIALAGLSLI